MPKRLERLQCPSPVLGTGRSGVASLQPVMCSAERGEATLTSFTDPMQKGVVHQVGPMSGVVGPSRADRFQRAQASASSAHSHVSSPSSAHSHLAPAMYREPCRQSGVALGLAAESVMPAGLVLMLAALFSSTSNTNDSLASLGASA